MHTSSFLYVMLLNNHTTSLKSFLCDTLTVLLLAIDSELLQVPQTFVVFKSVTFENLLKSWKVFGTFKFWKNARKELGLMPIMI